MKEMLRKITEEYEASVAKGSLGDSEIAKSASTFQDGTANSFLSARASIGNSVGNTGEMCCIGDNGDGRSRNFFATDAAEPIPVQEEAIYLGRPRVISDVSDNPFETVREIYLVQGDIAENAVETCERQEELLCTRDRAADGLQVRDFGDQTAIVEHDYVRAAAGENCEDSNATMSKHSETSGIVVKKIVLPVREHPSSRRTVWPLVNSVSSDVNPPVKKCRFSTGGSKNSDPSISGLGSSNPSVLRTLLQASRKQLKLYQSHNHTSKRLHLTSSSIRAAETNIVATQKVRKKDFCCQADMAVAASQAGQGTETSPCAGTREIEQSQSAVDSRSQIKALLLGQSYERQPQNETQSMAWDGGPQAEKQCYDHKCMRMQEHELPGFLCDVVDVVAEYKDLSYSVQTSHNKAQSIEVRRKGLYGVPYPGMTPAQVMIEEAGTAHFFTLVKLVFSVMCKDEDGQLTPDPLLQLLQKLSIKGGHVFCPGVEAELALVAPNTKNLTIYELLEPRYQAHDCPVWHMLGSNQSWFPLNEGVHKCKACKCLERYLRTLGKAKERKEIMTFS